MDVKEIEKRAEELRKELGGTIFAFPINETDPFSKYAVTMYMDGKFRTYPKPLDISDAASGILILLKELEKSGLDADYDRNVRLIFYDAQMNAPSVVMRRLKKDPESYRVISKQPLLKEGEDLIKKEGDYLFSARGLVKFSYLSMVDDKMPKAIQFMNEYYKLLAMRGYGKTASAIRQEVRRMSKTEAIRWIEKTYSQYVRDSMEIMNIMLSLKNG